MKKTLTVPKTVDEYIAAFDQPVKGLLEEMRRIIRKAAPRATELISYNMPTYKQHKALVYFGGYKQHIGFYPTPSAITAFRKEIEGYVSAKGSVQFPIDRPLPAALIREMVLLRLKEDILAAGGKAG